MSAPRRDANPSRQISHVRVIDLRSMVPKAKFAERMYLDPLNDTPADIAKAYNAASASVSADTKSGKLAAEGARKAARSSTPSADRPVIKIDSRIK